MVKSKINGQAELLHEAENLSDIKKTAGNISVTNNSKTLL